MLAHGGSAQGFTLTKLVRNSSDGLHSGVELRARNDSTVPLAVTRLTLTKCINLRVKCDTTYVNLPAIMSGEERAILTLLGLVSSQPIDFAYSVDWRPALECYNGVGGSGRDSTKPRPPESRQMILPPFDGNPHNLAVPVTFFVAAGGVVDSVSFDGVNDAKYAAELRATLMKYQFTGASDARGCPTAGVYRITLTFR